MSKHSRELRKRSGGLLRRALVVSATAATLFPTSGLRAEGESFGAGFFIGYNLSRADVEWGLEAFATHLVSSLGCSSERRAGLGPLLQVGLLGLGEPRLTLALQGGGEVVARSAAAISGELGLSYRFGAQSGFGIHSGVTAESLMLNAAFRYQWLLNEAWVGGGVRYLPTYGRCEATVGRPLRTEDGVLRRSEPNTNPALHVALAEDVRLAGNAYQRDAQLECASVPAFIQLAAELASHAAPHALIERALDAACEEMQHARLCAALASQHLRHAVQPMLPAVEPRRALAGSPGLLRLAAESWLDGCLVEGAAAAHAARAAQIASDPAVRAVHARIAADEQRHAELAWAILTWATERCGDDARDTLRSLQNVELAEVSPDAAPKGFSHRGRLGCEEQNALAQRHGERSRARLARLLG